MRLRGCGRTYAEIEAAAAAVTHQLGPLNRLLAARTGDLVPTFMVGAGVQPDEVLNRPMTNVPKALWAETVGFGTDRCRWD
ncbi:hypothetical protein D3C81_1837730 [compost metagenome]